VIQTLYNGGFDMILGGMTATEERFERVNFSIPYMDASSGILVKAGSGIADRAGLDGKVVAAGAGTPQIGQLEVTADELGISYDGEIKTYDDDAVAYQAMASGRIDAYVSTLVSLSEFTKTTEGFEILPFRSDRWATEYTAAAFRKEDDLAIGNIIGSNMFNLLGVLGIAAAIRPVEVQPMFLGRDFPVMFLLTGLMFLLASDFRGPGRIGRTAGAMLLFIFVGFQVMVWMEASQLK